MNTRNRVRIILIICTAVIAGWAGNKISYQIRTDLRMGIRLSDIINRVFIDIMNHPLHISTGQYDLLIGLGISLIALVMMINQIYKRARRRDGEEHGSSKWADPRALRRFMNRKDNTQNLWFASHTALSLDTHRTQRNLNALIIGSAGSGKTRYYVIPNLAQANTSFVVTDPKGEISAETYDFMRLQGYDVRTLNLIDFAKSDSYNPLAYFNPEQPEVDCMVLVENLITNTSGKRPTTYSGSDFWEKAERALLTALTLYAYYTSEYPTLVEVVDLLAQMKASETDEASKSYVDHVFDAIYETVAEYDADPTSYSEESKRLIDGLRFALSQYNTYTQGAGETKKSVIISLGVRLAPLHMTQIRRVLSADTIGLDTIGDKKTILYLIIPDTHAAFNFMAAIFYEQLFQTLILKADNSPQRHLDVPVQCFMDEFPNVGRIPAFERKIAVMRSRGISVSVIVQNFAQGKSLYKDDWETIVGNCDSTLFLGGTEESTTKYISGRLGKQTIITEDHSHSKGRNGSVTHSIRSSARDLMASDEVGRLPTHLCIYFLRGLLPVMDKKMPAISLPRERPSTGAKKRTR
ncbi:VirD4-like conjugal transfer protein, CD1115 family [Trueperella sp. LYQ143]|uniref:VirD4-like conjugal transfer protein, CD1115 family n=1 Tax=Trueperella sp. LYQ143 TaxID=3391059 RepID=UPI0039836FE5